MKRILFSILAVLCLSVGCSQEDATDLWSENIYPSTNNTYDIGSPILQYQDGYFVNVWASNNVVATNNMTATYFIGDGSQLTGIEQGELILYFLNTDSPDVAGADRLSSIYNTSEVTLTGAGLGDGNTLMGTWITDTGVPNIRLLEGNMRVHVAGKKTAGTKDAQFFYEVWKCNSSGTDIELISTSEYTDILTNVRTNYRIWLLSDETSFNYSDRIKVKGYAYVTGGGSAPTVEAYIQGASNTRLVVPVGAVSIERFVPYTGAVRDLLMGAYDISAHDGTFTSDVNITDDLTCDVAYTRTVGIEESLYHIGDPDTFMHFNVDEMYFKAGDVIGLKITDTLATFYNNMSIRQDGTIAPVAMANASAPNNSIFFSTDSNTLCYKDSLGNIFSLY
jgi:hypothetical protein